MSLKSRLEQCASAGSLTLPLPGGGATPQRLLALADFGAVNLSLARLAEAHVDALAILAEAGHTPRADVLYGVWASDTPPSHLECVRLDHGGWRIGGIKHYCSGATLIGAALVTARDREGVHLFDVPLDQDGVVPQPSRWVNPAFADTATTAVEFHDVEVPSCHHIGTAGWYLERPGFWHGSIGPAACWAGGAMFLVQAATRLKRRDAHSRAQLGALQATAWGLTAILEQAGREIDADAADIASTARTRGLKVRHLIERACTDVLDRFGRATGPQLLAYDTEVCLQHAALGLYIRQCHGERDLETIPD